MSRSVFYSSGTSLDLNEEPPEDVENAQFQGIRTPSSSSASSSSSWRKRHKRTCGVSSESEASLEYPETPITEEFKETLAEPTVQQQRNASESKSNETPSQLRRRSGVYDHQNQEDSAKLRRDRINNAAAHQSLPSPFSSPSNPFPIPPVSDASSYLDKVVLETVETEKIYVKDLKDIIRGYLIPFSTAVEIKIPKDDLYLLFGNIKTIYKFNRKFFESLKKCNHDPVKIGKSFIDHSDGFRVYAEYCTNYPRSLDVISRFCKDPRFFQKLKRLQVDLKHPLPLQTYLFKPVQRILKYHLLLKNIVAHHSELLPGHDVLVEAYDCMMGVAEHLNEMKRNQERRAEIQKLLLGSSGMDLSSFGDLILEDKFSLSGVREVHWAFLFRKGLLLAKKRRVDQLQIKTTIMCSNLTLVESVPKEPLFFQVLPFDSPKTQFTIQARTFEQKQLWCQEIKTLMLDSYNVAIPEKTRQLLMHTGKSHQENDHHGETSKLRQTAEYLSKRRLRRRSIGFVSGNNEKNLGVDNSVVGHLSMMVGHLSMTGRSSENIPLESNKVKATRSRPLVVDGGVHRQKSERRSQSLDSLHNVLIEDEIVPESVKCKSEDRQRRKTRKRHEKEAKQDEAELAFEKQEEDRNRYQEEVNSSIDSEEGKWDKATPRGGKSNSRTPSKRNKDRSKVAIEVQSIFLEKERKSDGEEETGEQLLVKVENLSEDEKDPLLLSEEKDKEAVEKPKVARSAALRASSFRKAVELNRVDSIAVKRPNIKVRRKPSEDPQESDRDDDDDDDTSSESSNEHTSPKFQSSLPPILDQSSDLTKQNPTSDSQEELNDDNNDASDDDVEPHVGSGNEKQLNDSIGLNNNSRCSSYSFLSTTFESLPPSECLTDVTQESLEGFLIEDKSMPKSPRENDEFSSLLSVSTSKVGIDEEPAASELNKELNISLSTVQDFGLSDQEGVLNISKNDPASDSRTVSDHSFKPSTEGFLDIATSLIANSSLSESPSVNSVPASPVDTKKRTVIDVDDTFLTKKETSLKNVAKPRRSSYTGALCESSETPVRNCYSLPCLKDCLSDEAYLCNVCRSIALSGVENPALKSPRELSSSDPTGEFSDHLASIVAGLCTSSSNSADSVKIPDQCKNNSEAEIPLNNNTEDDVPMGGVDGQKEEDFFKNSASTEENVSKEAEANRNKTEDGSPATNANSASLSLQKSNNKVKPRLFFEKVPNFSVSSPNEDQGAILRRSDRSETEVFMPRPGKIESINSASREQFSGAASDRSSSCFEGPSEFDHMQEYLNYRYSKTDHPQAYVYRLARAYSSRVKEMQKEAAVFKKLFQARARRPILRKWSSAADESALRLKDRSFSTSDKVSSKSSSSSQPRCSAHSTAGSSDMSFYSKSCSDTSDLSNRVEMDFTRRSTAGHIKSRSMKHGKPFLGLSFDSFPDFCVSRSGDDSHSDDCFDDESGSKESSLVKQRVKLFEGSTVNK